MVHWARINDTTNDWILKGGWFKGEGTTEPWGTLGKPREYPKP